jgi:hypothetical protein
MRINHVAPMKSNQSFRPTGRPVLAAIALAIAASGSRPSAAQIQLSTYAGKLWIVPNTAGQIAAFPPPAATPDATFQASSVALFTTAPPPIGRQTLSTPYANNTLLGFLSSAITISDLKFSGQINPLLGAALTAKSAPADRVGRTPATYGLYVEFTGWGYLLRDEFFTVLHDGGVSVRVNGDSVGGIRSTGDRSTATSESFPYNGPSGLRLIDVVYANFTGQGVLAFSPNVLPWAPPRNAGLGRSQ